MSTQQTNRPPTVVMIAESVSDNHQSVQINCSNCNEVQQLVLAESQSIKNTILQIQMLLLELMRLNEIRHSLPPTDK